MEGEVDDDNKAGGAVECFFCYPIITIAVDFSTITTLINPFACFNGAHTSRDTGWNTLNIYISIEGYVLQRTYCAVFESNA